MAHNPARGGLAALVFILSVATAPAAEPAPAPRPLYPRFDLDHLPAVEGQGVLGFRPAEIARYATPAQAERARGLLLGLYAQLMGAKDLDPAAWPTFRDIEQCVLCLEMRVTAPDGEERGTFVVGGKTPGLLKTTRPFDWEGMFRKAFPTAPARHAGRPYLRVSVRFPLPFPLSLFNLLAGPMGVYTPDDRTLVIGSEDQIQALLARLEAGGPAPAPPPGWGDVDRDLIALALDNRREPLVSGRFPADRPAAGHVGALGDSLQTLAVGLAVGGQTRVRVEATARDEGGARAIAASLRGLCALGAAAGEEPDPVEALGAALLGSADLRCDGRRVTGRLTAPGNLVEAVLAAIGGAD